MRSDHRCASERRRGPAEVPAPKVESDANALASSTKSDLPSQSSAVQSSVKTLKTAVQGLPASPSRQQSVAVAADVNATVTAFDNFKKATNSKCS
jgi:hypothetical protein